MSLLELPACPFFDDVHTERLEGFGSFYHTYEFSIPSNHPSAEMAVEKGLVVFPDLDGDTKCFVIKTVDEESSPDGLFKRCFAEDSAQDELSCVILEAASPWENHTCTAILEHILAGTRWEVGDVERADTTTTDADFMDYPTAWEGVLWLAAEFSLEVSTRVIVSGNQIVARYIDLLQSRGTYSGQIIEYARDTAAITRSGDGGEIYSKVIGLGASQSDGTYLLFDDVEWLVASGDPCDKPLADWWIESDDVRLGKPGDENAGVTEVVGYGIPLSNGTVAHRVGVFRDPDEERSDWLLDKTWAFFKKHMQPQYTYDVRPASLERMPAQRPGDLQRSWERIRLGDTVTVRDTATYPPYTDEPRVIETRRCYSDPTQDSITLGEPVKRVSDFIADSVRLKRRVSQKEGGWAPAP